ncbi:NDR1/HIN1-like protein 12 isoform X2 [Salvia hispanica]|uniref:NDR1/HIN1-like protein 12 isoform X2 n=1 Tax=Salvia hispanica TaxID=49212 RepID=UPI00200973DA|nr:NDR1/HIN1-like protein 12 isoform X2 [Salvia hispanica]
MAVPHISSCYGSAKSHESEGGVVIFIGYATLRPKVPQVSVTRAQMDTIYFDQSTLMMLHATIVIKAENDNTRARARFYDMSYTLSFRSQKIAILMADPFDVSPNRSLELNFVVPSQSIPLNPEEVEAINWSLNRNVVDLDLRGMSRTRWKVWLIGSIKYVLRLDCRLHLPVDQTTIYPHCVSRK